MSWIAANDPDNAMALDDLAVATDLFDRCSDFHKSSCAEGAWRSVPRLTGAFRPVPFEIRLLEQAVVLITHHVRLRLGDKIHDHHNNDQ